MKQVSFQRIIVNEHQSQKWKSGMIVGHFMTITSSWSGI